MSQRNGVDAVVVQADATSIIAQWQITTLAIKHRLLAIYQVREFVQDGGLISYGPSITEMTRRSAMFVDEILKGIKPTDLPIEQPTKFELAINLTTAKALGLIVLPSLPARADVTPSVGAMMDHPRRMKDTMADAYVAEGRGDDRRVAVPQRVWEVNCAVRANDVPNFVARTGVRRQDPCGND